MFYEKQDQFYNELRGKKISVSEPPTLEQIEQYWKPIFEKEKLFNKSAPWLDRYKRSLDITCTNFSEINVADVASNIKI